MANNLDESKHLFWNVCIKTLFCIGATSAVLILYLSVLTYCLIEKVFKKKEVSQINEKLYFGRMAGSGIICCKDCDYSDKVDSFLHGFGSPR